MKKLLPAIADKGLFFLAVSQFAIVFSINFVNVFIPFYIPDLSDFGPRETMLWIGLIMGAPPLVAALSAPFWGRLTYRFRPKFLFEQGILWTAVIFMLYGFAGNLYLLLFLRLMHGLLGGVSTIGLVLISILSPKEKLHKDMGLYQIAMTMGQLAGPPVGAFLVPLAGYRLSFVISSLVVAVFYVFGRRHIKDVPSPEIKPNSAGLPRKGIFWAWGLALIATIHLTYPPSILPHILENFQLRGTTALNVAGMIMMAYMGASILGNYLISSFAPRARLRQVILYTCLLAAFFQAVLFLGDGVFSFTVIRMLQTGFIAAVFPMIISVFAAEAGGGMLGLLNSARFGGNSVGPFMAAAIVAYSNLLTLYLIITGLTLITLAAFLRTTRQEPSAEQKT